MITKFKIFENNDIMNITEGDYVLLNIKTVNKEYNEFVNNNVGEVIRLKTKKYHEDENDIYLPYKIEVKYNSDVEDFKRLKTFFQHLDYDYVTDYYTFSSVFDISYVMFYGKTEEEVKIKYNSNKYNL